MARRKQLLQMGWLGVVTLLLSACFNFPDFTSGEQTPLLAYIERKVGRIVYVGADGNIYTNNQGGIDEKAITTDAQTDEASGRYRYYQFPTWAPDSKQVAFVSIEGSRDTPEGFGIFTADTTVEEPLLNELFSSPNRSPFYLYWSPDSQNLTFLAGAPPDQMLLELASVDGERTQILDVGQPLYWSWAPDGNQLFMHVNGSGSGARLAFLTVDGEVVEQGLDYIPVPFQAPAWSPDGSQLMLAATIEGSDHGLVLADNQGRLERIITQVESEQSIAFGWSPDGQKVAYIVSQLSQTAGALGKLTVRDLANGEVATVSTEEEEVAAFFWAPDSQKLAYFVPIQGSGGSETQPADLLLSLRMLDVVNGRSTELTTFLPTPLFLNIIPFFDQYQQSATIWSPDSKNLVVSGLNEAQIPQILVVSTEGNLQPRFIANGFIGFWSWE